MKVYIEAARKGKETDAITKPADKLSSIHLIWLRFRYISGNLFEHRFSTYNRGPPLVLIHQFRRTAELFGRINDDIF